jgi:type II secretory pathway component PulC
MRIAFVAMASLMFVTALSLQALGAWHVYQSFSDDTGESEPMQCLPSSSSPSPVQVLQQRSSLPLVQADPPPVLTTPTPHTFEPCDFGELILIATNEDPRWSFAAVRNSGGSARMHGYNEMVGGHTIETIGWNSIVLANGDDRCMMKLGAPAPSKPTGSERTGTRLRASGQPVDQTQLLATLDEKIHVNAPGDIVIERSAVDLVLENLNQLWRGAQLRPVEGGVKMTRLPRGELFEKIGLRRGDVLQTLNGFDVTVPREMLQAYGQLPNADHLTVTFLRGGQRMAIDLKLR